MKLTKYFKHKPDSIHPPDDYLFKDQENVSAKQSIVMGTN
jgi:hypothetical protein